MLDDIVLSKLSDAMTLNKKEFESIYQVVSDIEETLNILESGKFTLYENINSYEQLGYWWVIDKEVWGEVPTYVQDFINYKAIGKELEGFKITENGALRIYY